MIAAGLGLMALGWLIIFLTVVHVIPDKLYLLFLAHALSLTGFIIGLIGIIQRHRPGGPPPGE